MHWGFHPWFFVFPFLFLVLIAVRMFTWRRFGRPCCGGYGYGYGGDDAMAMLRRRLVNGEINEEEYQRLKQLLTK